MDTSGEEVILNKILALEGMILWVVFYPVGCLILREKIVDKDSWDGYWVAMVDIWNE